MIIIICTNEAVLVQRMESWLSTSSYKGVDTEMATRVCMRVKEYAEGFRNRPVYVSVKNFAKTRMQVSFEVVYGNHNVNVVLETSPTCVAKAKIFCPALGLNNFVPPPYEELNPQGTIACYAFASIDQKHFSVKMQDYPSVLDFQK